MNTISSSTEEDIVILAPSSVKNSTELLNLKKESKKILDGTSASQMSRQGDSTAVSALQRVTGINIKDGKYIIIRGLNERYSLARYNQFYLPPLDSNKKQVPLDLFPTQSLSSIEVQKSYSSELPGEFGGGLVTLKSNYNLGFNGFKFQAGLSLNPNEKMSTNGNGSLDDLGQDDGYRKLPLNIENALNSGIPLVEGTTAENGFAKEQLKSFGQSLKKNYNINQINSQQIPRLQVLSSHSHQLEKIKLSHVETFSYAQDKKNVSTNQYNYDKANATDLVLSEENTSEISQTETQLSGTFAGQVDFSANNKLTLDLLFLRSTSNKISMKNSQGPGLSDYFRQNTKIDFTQRDLISQQISHESRFYGFQFLNGVALAQVKKNVPDSKEYTYKKRQSTSNLELDSEVSGNLRTWSQLQENAIELQSSVSKDFHWMYPSKLQFGLQNLNRTRNSNSYRLQYVKNYIAGQEPDLTLPPDQIYSDSEDWILVNQTESADKYTGDLNKTSSFIHYNIDFPEDLFLQAGLHLEDTQIEVNNYRYGQIDPASGSALRAVDALPNLTLTKNIDSANKIVVSANETIATPDFRELSPVRYYDEESGYEARGNSNLKNTVIFNLDLRYENYPKDEEIYSLGGFYKKFQRPIEDTYFPVAGSLLKVPKNAESGSVFGIEGEVKIAARKWSRSLRYFGLNLNASLMQSQVDLDPAKSGNLTNTNRALQGQSPWILNSELYFKRESKGLLLSLSYNVTGPKIFAVGTDSRPDVIENPFHQIDMNASYDMNQNGKISFKWKNIFDSEKVLKLDDKINFKTKKGSDLYVSYSYQI